MRYEMSMALEFYAKCFGAKKKKRYFNNAGINDGLSASELTALGKIEKGGANSGRWPRTTCAKSALILQPRIMVRTEFKGTRA